MILQGEIMARSTSVQDPALLEAALEGLENQKQRIEDQIEQVKTLLRRSLGQRGRPVHGATKASSGKRVLSSSARKRVLSSSARKRIAEAQKKRWAEFRRRNAASPE